MGQKTADNEGGYKWTGGPSTFEDEINMVNTDTPFAGTTGGPFTWDVRTNEIRAWVLRDPVKGDAVVLDTVAGTLTLVSNYRAIGFGGEVKSTVSTTDDTVTEISKITTLTEDTVHIIEIAVTSKSDNDLEYGSWIFRLCITKLGGVVVIRQVETTFHNSSAGLSAVSVTFAVNSGDVDIDVAGIAAGPSNNLVWNCQYKTISTSTN